MNAVPSNRWTSVQQFNNARQFQEFAAEIAGEFPGDASTSDRSTNDSRRRS